MFASQSSAKPIAQVFAERAASNSQRFQIELNGSTTAYWLYAAKEPHAQDLVLVHGYRGTHSGLEAIAGLLPDFNIYIPDLPGFGESKSLISGTTLDGYADWLGEFVTNVAPRAQIVAHSYGTLIAGIAAAKGLLTGRKLVLINPIGSVERTAISKLEASVEATVYRLAEKLSEQSGRALLRSKLTVRTMSVFMAKTKDKALRKWIHQQHDQHFSQFETVSVAVAGFETGLNTYLNEYAPQITNSVSLIVGELDDITPQEAQARLKLLFTNAESHTILGVGHLVHYETPDEAAQLIRDFLNR